MGNRTEVAPGFGPKELRASHGGFPGWRGLQRTGDVVLKLGRFYRLWNVQLNDGEIGSRGGQTAFSAIGTATGRDQCVTSIFSPNIEYPDIGERAEIRFTEAADYATQSLDEQAETAGLAYRGDSGIVTASVGGSTGRQRWLRDGSDNTSSGAICPTGTNSSVRIRDKIYLADLNGAIKSLSPGTTSYTTIAAAGAEFGAASRPLAMTYQGKLVVVGAGVLKTYEIDSGTWAIPAMPGGTTAFVPKGWTVWDVDDCLYIWGIVPTNDSKLLKFDGTTISVVYSLVAGGSIVYYQAVDLASNNDQLVLTYIQQDSTIVSLQTVYSTNGTAFTAATLPTPVTAGSTYSASRMCVADGMIWSIGVHSEGLTDDNILMNSYDGSEWLDVFVMPDFTGDDGVFMPVDIVEIAPVDSTISDDTAP